ncbi:MAG: HlyD family efflux transporter periplasmic adaptor subunit [Myxococcales bacterium]|nr:HlyD family efflux transporter periplasmic adaptor subunit [Myxococcales bacterium]
MPNPFEHTLRSIRADRSRAGLGLLAVALTVLTGWTLWLVRAEVGVWEVTAIARIEASSAGHRVAAVTSGRVIAATMTVGEPVAAGDVLIELDPVEAELRREEVDATIASLDALIGLREREVTSEREAVVALERAAGAAQSEAAARLDRAVAAARLAEAEATEVSALEGLEISSGAEARRTQAEAVQLAAATRELRSASSRQRWEATREVQDRLLAILRIEADLERLRGERAAAQARARQLAAELERYTIRAPIAGELGDAAPLEVGAYVEAGDIVATVVPAGGLRIVGHFDPASAIGRIAPGQPAVLRLSGFPWTEYGVIRGEVERVASEIRDGRIRVELAIVDAPTTIPLAHGLPGALEVEVERTSPANLLLRAAGRGLSQAGAPAGEGAPGR